MLRRSLALAVVIAITSPGSEARADGATFVKGPYLQDLRSRGAQVRWETSSESGGTLVVKGPGAFVREVHAATGLRYHTLSVDGLEPATTYAYTVKVGDEASPEGHFTTAPEDARPITFLVYGDNRSDPTAHAAVVEAMRRTPSDFFLHTGDMVLSGNDGNDWQSFFDIETPLLRDRCVFATVGNHELLGGGKPAFLSYFQIGDPGAHLLHATTRWGSSRFFFLNAMSTWGDGEERGWLEAELTRSDSEPGIEHRFVVTHHGPFSSGPHGGNDAMKKAGAMALMKKHHVDLIFAGHDHIYERGELDGIRYLISGGGGAPLYKPRRSVPAATEVVEAAHHFVEVKVDGPRITTVARRLDGMAMDTCVLLPGALWSCETTLPPARKPGEAPAAEGDEVKRKCGCELPAGGDQGWPVLGWAGLLALLAVRRSLPRGR